MRQPTICERRRSNGAVTYFAQIGGKQVGLGTDRKAAQKRFGELLADRKTDGSPNPRVRDLIAQFLRWSERNQEANTHRFYGGRLAGDQKSKTNFSDFIPSGLRVKELKRNVVTNWLDENYAHDSANYRNAAVRSVKRALKWASDEELIGLLTC